MFTEHQLYAKSCARSCGYNGKRHTQDLPQAASELNHHAESTQKILIDWTCAETILKTLCELPGLTNKNIACNILAMAVLKIMCCLSKVQI